jgi:rRNA biogenesis protein RRP5
LLFVDAESRRVALTALPHLVALSGASPLVSAERVAVGATVEGVVARRLAGVGLELALSDAPHRRCFVHTSNIADSVRDSEVAGDALVTAAAYAPGTVHAVRVLGESWLDGALVGSMRASVLASAIVSLHDAVPGMRLRARITRVGARTLHVLLGNGVRGTVAALHMADVPVRDVSARFHVQQQIDVRVLDVAPLRHRVYLSAKPTLVESALAVVSTLADAQPGTLTHAVVSKLVRAGVFVGLYGGLSGFIPLRELSVERVSDAATVCAVGDVVRCRVLGVDDSTRRVLLSLVVSDEAQRAVEEARSATSALVGVVDLNAVLTRGCDVGSFVDGAVTALDDESVTLELQIGPADDSVRVSTTMLRAHLGDTDAAATTSLAVGDVLRELLVLRVAGGRRRALVTVTHKRSLIDAARAGELLTAVADAVVGRVYAGAVTSVTPHAVFVGFAGVLTGYAARRELGDAPLPRAASVPFVVGQSVRALVREQQTRAADSDIAHAHSLSVSLRPSMCASPAGTYLAAYLADVGASSASTMGAVVRGVVLPHGDDDETSDAASLTLELADGECVLAVGAHAARTTTSDNADATESELALDRVGARAAAGAKLAAVVLDDVSAPRRVSLRRVLVDAARRRLTDAPDKGACRRRLCAVLT